MYLRRCLLKQNRLTIEIINIHLCLQEPVFSGALYTRVCPLMIISHSCTLSSCCCWIHYFMVFWRGTWRLLDPESLAFRSHGTSLSWLVEHLSFSVDFITKYVLNRIYCWRESALIYILYSIYVADIYCYLHLSVRLTPGLPSGGEPSH